MPLPVAEETLHVLARPAVLVGRPVLLLPCTGPAGLRGRRFRVTSPHLGARREVVVSMPAAATSVRAACIIAAVDAVAIRTRSTP